MSVSHRLFILGSLVCLQFGALWAAEGKSDAHSVQLTTLQLDQRLPTRGRLGGVTVDRLGFIYVSNFAESVWRVSPEGEVKLLTDGLYGASGNAIDARGNLLQANFYANTVSRIRRTGEIETLISEDLNGPVGIAVSNDGDTYICNCSGNFITRVDSAGKSSRLVSNPSLGCPNGITLGKDGGLFVVSFGHGIVFQITPAGEMTRFATIPEGGNAHIALARSAFYVTKISSNKIYRVTLDGQVSHFAGTGEVGLADGAVLEAGLARPNGIATGPTGSVLYLNNLDGVWRGGGPGSVVLRKIELPTLAQIVDDALSSGGLELARKRYQTYRSDPAHSHEDTKLEVNSLGTRRMGEGDLATARAVFEWNAESYPDWAFGHLSLGRVYALSGQREAAIRALRRALEIDPDNQPAAQLLKQLQP